MACPFFEPLKHWREARERAPLGDYWSGVCRAGQSPFTPDDQTLSELCNMGYARGHCPRFPANHAPDAIRFLIASDRAQMIQIQYAIECNHHPHAQGTLEYSRIENSFTHAERDGSLERQAAAYVASYLLRRPAAA